MRTIRTAILDELYAHLAHNLESQETLGLDPETGRALHMEYQSVRRDEGRLILRVLTNGTRDGPPVQRELNITVEKT